MDMTPIIKFAENFLRPGQHPQPQGTNSASLKKSAVNRKQVNAVVGPPIITFGTTMNYTLMYNDHGSGAHMDGAFYRPTAPDGWFIIGDYAQGNYNPPQQPSITIKVDNDDPSNPVLAAPTGYNLVWDDKGSGAKRDGSIWVPVPQPGYVALGAVSQNGYGMPDISQLRCIRFDLVQRGEIGNLIWNDQGSGAHMDLSAYAIVGLTTFYAQGNYHPPLGPVWLPKALLSSGS